MNHFKFKPFQIFSMVLIALCCSLSTGCDNEQDVLDVETPSGDVDVDRDKDSGEVDVDVDED
ncbi:hypothetical protein [Rubinisphaera sp.]|uniref:hypothetical protein n=1 Tax=Rubinisphaera sp. TaxID=2024857 RepID=UPI000C10BB8D|nr:hypothetical protein [Rubinisphaera sp.]MBV08028.1 hypothetical protein [Rubinisphaera sp.]HCS52014.1 hypothetical protein [Planctomycetaceae bacterium]|tara:strand:+ start:625 stop:810 length:186 start_codon:yes stop_codon:yes gene_type:complete